MAVVAGQPGYTQTDRHNITDEFRIRGVRVSAAGDNLIYVTRLEDFESFSDTEVFLSGGKRYCVAGHIDIGGRIFFADGPIFIGGIGASISSITSSATIGALLNTAHSITVDSILLSSLNIPMFNVVFSEPSILGIRDTQMECLGGGILVGVPGSSVFTSLASVSSSETSPLTFDGDWTRIDLDNFFPRGISIASSETFVEFKSTITVAERLLITTSFFNVDAGGIGYKFNGLSGFQDESIQIVSNKFEGEGAFIDGLTGDDIQSYLRANIGVIDSIPAGAWSIEDNATATTIITQDTDGDGTGAVPAVGVTNPNQFSQKITHQSSPNGMTIDSSREQIYNVSSSITVSTSSNNQKCNVWVFRNGVSTGAKASATTTGSAGGGRAENMTISIPLILSKDDFVQIYLSNSSGTGDITMEYGFLTIEGTQ